MLHSIKKKKKLLRCGLFLLINHQHQRWIKLTEILLCEIIIIKENCDHSADGE